MGLTNYSNVRSHTGSGHGHEDIVLQGRRPFLTEIIYYSADLISVVRKGRPRDRDVLANFDVFQSAWRVHSAARPFTFKLVTLPTEEPITGKAVAGAIRPTVQLERTNFDELVPLLKDLRAMILEGDGFGRGNLRQGGHAAEPVQPEKWHLIEAPDFDPR
jgi:hypothetical protein